MKNQQSVLISGLIALLMMFTAAFQCGRSSSTPTTSSTPRPQKTTTTKTTTTNGQTLTEADVRNAFQDYYDGLADSHSKAHAPARAEIEYLGGINIVGKDEYDRYIVKAPHTAKLVAEANGQVQQTYEGYSKNSGNFYFYWKVDKWTWRFE